MPVYRIVPEIRPRLGVLLLLAWVAPAAAQQGGSADPPDP